MVRVRDGGLKAARTSRLVVSGGKIPKMYDYCTPTALGRDFIFFSSSDVCENHIASLLQIDGLDI